MACRFLRGLSVSSSHLDTNGIRDIQLLQPPRQVAEASGAAEIREPPQEPLPRRDHIDRLPSLRVFSSLEVTLVSLSIPRVADASSWAPTSRLRVAGSEMLQATCTSSFPPTTKPASLPVVLLLQYDTAASLRRRFTNTWFSSLFDESPPTSARNPESRA